MENKLSSIIVEDLSIAAQFLARCCDQNGDVEVLGIFSNVSDALNFLNRVLVKKIQCITDIEFS